MTEATLIKTLVLAVSRETVWSYLTEKDKLAQWFHPATADFVEGEDYALMDNGKQKKLCWGTVLRMDKPHRLVYSFTIEPLRGALTTVTWTLTEAQGGTLLTLQHDGIEKAAGEAALKILQSLDKGWDQHADHLRDLFASPSKTGCNH